MTKEVKLSKIASILELIVASILFLVTGGIILTMVLSYEAIESIFIELVVVASVVFAQFLIAFIDGLVFLIRSKKGEESVTKHRKALKVMGVTYFIICFVMMIITGYNITLDHLIVELIFAVFFIVYTLYFSIAIYKIIASKNPETNDKPKIISGKTEDQLLENVFDRIAMANQIYKENLISEREYAILKNKIMEQHFINKK